MTIRWTVEEYLLRAIEAQQENVGHLYARLDKDISLTVISLGV